MQPVQLLAQKHVVKDDILFPNHLAGKWENLVEVMECYLPHREDMVQIGCDQLKLVLTGCCT